MQLSYGPRFLVRFMPSFCIRIKNCNEWTSRIMRKRHAVLKTKDSLILPAFNNSPTRIFHLSGINFDLINRKFSSYTYYTLKIVKSLWRHLDSKNVSQRWTFFFFLLYTDRNRRRIYRCCGIERVNGSQSGRREV